MYLYPRTLDKVFCVQSDGLISKEVDGSGRDQVSVEGEPGMGGRTRYCLHAKTMDT